MNRKRRRGAIKSQRGSGKGRCSGPGCNGPSCNGPGCNGIALTQAVLTAWRDQHAARTRDAIRRVGWSINYIHADQAGPSFAYTVGLSGFEHPELIVFAQDPSNAEHILNTLGTAVRDGDILAAGRPLELRTTRSHRVRLVPVPWQASEEYLLEANTLYRSLDGMPIPASQVVVGDAAGHFPWEPDHQDCCSNPLHRQPVLGNPHNDDNGPLEFVG